MGIIGNYCVGERKERAFSWALLYFSVVWPESLARGWCDVKLRNIETTDVADEWLNYERIEWGFSKRWQRMRQTCTCYLFSATLHYCYGCLFRQCKICTVSPIDAEYIMLLPNLIAAAALGIGTTTELVVSWMGSKQGPHKSNLLELCPEAEQNREWFWWN